MKKPENVQIKKVKGEDPLDQLLFGLNVEIVELQSEVRNQDSKIKYQDSKIKLYEQILKKSGAVEEAGNANRYEEFNQFEKLYYKTAFNEIYNRLDTYRLLETGLIQPNYKKFDGTAKKIFLKAGFIIIKLFNNGIGNLAEGAYNLFHKHEFNNHVEDVNKFFIGKEGNLITEKTIFSLSHYIARRMMESVKAKTLGNFENLNHEEVAKKNVESFFKYIYDNSKSIEKKDGLENRLENLIEIIAQKKFYSDVKKPSQSKKPDHNSSNKNKLKDMQGDGDDHFSNEIMNVGPQVDLNFDTHISGDAPGNLNNFEH